MTNTCLPLLTGRKPLISDLKSISSKEEMLSELERIMPKFLENRVEIRYLQKYYSGNHPAVLERCKTIREDINNKIVVNYAFSATRDIVGYFLGKPVQYVHYDSKESNSDKVSEFNRILNSEEKNLINVEVADDQSITGVGYLGTFISENKKNGTSLKLERLDPAYTFVVKSSAPDIDELYCVNYFNEQEDPLSGKEAKTVYTVWTQNKRYIIRGGKPSMFSKAGINEADIEESDFSYGGYLPIHEFPNNTFRLGDWEPALSLMDAIDLNASDRLNDIAQTVQAILVALGVDLSQEGVMEQLSEGILNVPNVSNEAMKPIIDYIGSPLDASIGDVLSTYLESCMNVVIGVPDRKTRSGGGGDTGTAVELRDGWMDIDLVASFKEPFFIKADRDVLGAILYILDTKNEFSGLDIKDIDIKFSRNKTANIQVKAQALSNLLNAGIHPQDAIEWVDVTTDVSAVVDRLREWGKEKEADAIENVVEMQKATASDDGQNDDGSQNDDNSNDNSVE